MRRLFGWTALLVAFLLVVPIWADIIYLEDGTIIRGRIVDQTENSVFVLRKGVKIQVDRYNIKKIEKGGASSRQTYLKKLAKIGEGDAEGHYQLGKWLKSVNMDKEAYEEFTKTIIIDPGHRGAREKLGYILTPDGWKIPSEEKKTPEPKVERRPADQFRGNLPPQAKSILRKTLSKDRNERQKAFQALRELRKKIAAKLAAEASGEDSPARKSILRKLAKIDAEFAEKVGAMEKAGPAEQERLKQLVATYLKKSFDKQVNQWLTYQRKRMINRLESLMKKLEKMASLAKGKTKETQEKFLKKWQEVRKEALRVIFDKQIYPDANHGRSGQPTVDEKVKALRQVYEFFDILLKRAVARFQRISSDTAKQALAQINQYRKQIQEFEGFLGQNGMYTTPHYRPLHPRADTLLRIKAGEKVDTSKMDTWGRLMAQRLSDMDVMKKNKRIAQRAGISGEELKQIEITNRYRMSMGRRALTVCPPLCKAAKKHSEEMVRLGYFAHQSPTPSLRTPSMRAMKEGHSGMVGENIFMSSGGATAQDAFNGWYNSSGHHRNMLSDKWTCMGVGHNVTHWTQMFGAH